MQLLLEFFISYYLLVFLFVKYFCIVYNILLQILSLRSISLAMWDKVVAMRKYPSVVSNLALDFRIMLLCASGNVWSSKI